MTGALGLVFAQVGAETRTRLRSTSTLVAALAIFAASFLWIQDPSADATSLSWKSDDGVRTTGVYSADFVGLVSAVLAASFLPLIGFYLVAGSVRRDRESGIGAILAATPLSNATYVLGKWIAHSAYLIILQALAIVSGALVFWRWGSGPFAASAFVVPSLLLATPGLALTAALAVLFETTPGLRGRGGLVVYFFACILLLFVIPAGIGGLLSETRPATLTLYDPAGVVTVRHLVATAIPDSVPNSVSVGVIVSKDPVRRVPWPGGVFSWALAARRAASLLFLLPPLAAAILLFDRFDPARWGPGNEPAGPASRLSGEDGSGPPAPRESQAPSYSRAALRPVAARPRLADAVVAEAWLVWDLASWIRWPLLTAAVASAFTPAATAAFLLLLAPVISEVGARETLHGTRALVFCQPSVPRSPVLWKAAATALFVLLLGAPTAPRALLTSPAHAVAFVTGLLFVAAFAVGAGSLTGGGKFFSAVYTALWYVAVSGKTPLDFCGVFGGGLEAGVRTTYVAIAATVLGLAHFVEQRRRRGS